METRKKGKLKKRQLGGNKVFRLAMVVFAVYAGVTIVQLQVDVRQRQRELSDVQQKCEQQRIQNKELELQLSRGDDADYIERTARERLNFVHPYEKVYINAAGN